MRAKLLMPRMAIRGMGIGDLRAYLQALAQMREAGDHSQALLDTHDYVLTEVERRGLEVKKPEPRTPIPQGVVYKMPAISLRAMIAAYEKKASPSEQEQRTLDQLLREQQRRKDHAKYIYRKRLKEAQEAACFTP